MLGSVRLEIQLFSPLMESVETGESWSGEAAGVVVLLTGIRVGILIAALLWQTNWGAGGVVVCK